MANIVFRQWRDDFIPNLRRPRVWWRNLLRVVLYVGPAVLFGLLTAGVIVRWPNPTDIWPFVYFGVLLIIAATLFIKGMVALVDRLE